MEFPHNKLHQEAKREKWAEMLGLYFIHLLGKKKDGEQKRMVLVPSCIAQKVQMGQ